MPIIYPSGWNNRIGFLPIRNYHCFKMKIAYPFLFIICVILSACLNVDGPLSNPTLPTDQVNQDSVSRWEALKAETPHAYLTPLPVSESGPFDGTYVKVDQSPPQYWKCLRCADYRPVGGIWKMSFDRGIMRIFYEVTGWFSISSYSITGDSLTLFNDPFCPFDTGRYNWVLQDDQLILYPEDDSVCAFGLREENLSKQSWQACSEPTGNQPPGCKEPEIPQFVLLPDLPVEVNVYGGDSRFFEDPPDVYVAANTADRLPPGGIEIEFHEGSVDYGLHRILWWNGDWIEARTDLPFSSMGVQIMGEAQIGWATVRFDDMLVWQGDTADIWEKLGRHGGYVEISGYQPGHHTLRVEAQGFDFRPVTIAGFGYRTKE